MHPALLDSALQCAAAACSGRGSMRLPFEVRDFRRIGTLPTEWVHATATGDDEARVRLHAAGGELVAELSVRVREVDEAALRAMAPDAGDLPLYRVAWRSSPLAEAGPSAAEPVRVYGADRLREELEGSPGWDGVSWTSDPSQPGGTLACLWDADARVGSVPDAAEALACEALQTVQHAIACGEPPALLWVTRGGCPLGSSPVDPVASTLWGLGRVVQVEHPELCLKLVDVGDWSDTAGASWARELAPSEDRQIAYRDGSRYVARLCEDDSREGVLALPEAETCALVLVQPGRLDSLVLEPRVRRDPGPDEVEIRVLSTGLNFRDVLIALGTLRDRSALGYECTGVVSSVGANVTHVAVGDPVMALAQDCFGAYAVTEGSSVAAIPAGCSFEEAATLPVAFVTAHYALRDLGGLQAGERVLIHAAAGGVGMAAVQLALAQGAEVYATASPPKWGAVRALGVEHVMNSRTLDFGAEVLEATGGRGVDVVLNSLTGDAISEGLRALAVGGRFIEMGKAEVWSDSDVRSLRRDVRYRAFDLGEAGQQRFAEILEYTRASVEAGTLRPLPRTRYPLARATDAFRDLAKASHVGKLVVVQPPDPGEADAGALETGTALITGGLGALGFEVAEWLAARGARSLALLSRSEPDEKQRKRVAGLENQGVDVLVLQADVSRRADVDAALAAIRERGCLSAVFHAAGVLDDGLLMDLSPERMAGVMAAKARGAWNLHEATRGLDLEHFVLFSSGASLFGSPGQGNYAAANAFLDGLAHYRRGMGLAGLSINWGAWAEVGLAAELDTARGARRSVLLPPLTSHQGLDLLGRALRSDATQLGAFVLRARAHRGAVPPFMAELLQERRAVSAGGLRVQLQGLAQEERLSALQRALQGIAARVLRLDPDQVPLQTPLKELGLDSLTALEIRNVLAEELGLFLSASLLFDYPRLQKLADFLLAKLEMTRETAAPARPARSDGWREIEELSEEDAELELAAELASLED